MIQYARLPQGGWIAYEVHGNGAPLLLLRPLGGTMASWDGFADRLAEHFRVIRYDSLGRGHSSPGPVLTTTRAMAQDALALLDALAIPHVHVYGISLGGMIATWLALDAPHRVNKLVLASTPSSSADFSVHGIPLLLRLTACLLRPAAAAESCVAVRVLRPELRQQCPQLVRSAALHAREGRPSRLSLLGHLWAVLHHDVRERLGDLAADTLVLVGQHDPLLTYHALRTLLRDIPRATFSVIEGAGHDLSAEKPRETAAKVREWLAPP